MMQLNSLAKEAFKKALADMFFPPLPEPEIIHSKKERTLISIDKKTWKLRLNTAFPLPVDQENIIKFYRVVWRKGIAYYTVCPYDSETAIKIVTAATSETGVRVGTLAANLLVELIVTNYLYRIFRDDTLWFYQALYSKTNWKQVIENNLLILSTLVLERILGIVLVPNEIRRKINKKIIEASIEICNLLERGGMLTQQMWPDKARRIAIILKNLIEPDIKVSYRKKQEYAEKFLRDITEPDIFLAISRSNIKELQEEIMEKFARSIFEITGENIVKATKAVLALKIFSRPRDILRYWYRDRARGRVKIELYLKKEKVSDVIIYPDVWKIEDSPESLDVILSLSSFPIMIPNITTKKWIEAQIQVGERLGQPPDLLIILDSSGSMRYFPGWKKPFVDKKSEEYKYMKALKLKYHVGSKFDIALVSAFAALEYAVVRNVKVAAVNFSGKGIVCDWTHDRRKIEDTLMIFQGNGTELPRKKILKLIDKTDSRLLILLITDAEIYNEKDAMRCLNEIVARDHILYIFHIEEPGYYPVLETARKLGGRIIRVRKLEELTDIVIREISKYYTIL